MSRLEVYAIRALYNSSRGPPFVNYVVFREDGFPTFEICEGCKVRPIERELRISTTPTVIPLGVEDATFWKHMYQRTMELKALQVEARQRVPNEVFAR